MKTSAFSRALELAKLASKVGLKELQSKDLKSRLEQARLISQSLSQLKGAAMKVGQLLSLDLEGYFPPEAIEVLSQLQNAAVAHPLHEIEKVLKNELSREHFELITHLSPTPLGVASVGQVHRARFREKDVAIKVQYPQVANSVESDLKILKVLASSLTQLSGRSMNFDPLFLEFRSLLEQELDYKIEAQFQTQFKAKILEIVCEPGVEFSVPEVIPEISTSRVLATQFAPGLSLRSWIHSKPSWEVRHKTARTLLLLYFHEFFKWGLVQTDPNWGNFLMDSTDSKLRIHLLDFGATRSYSKDFINTYIQLLEAAAENDQKKVKARALEFGLIDPRESEEAFQQFQKLLKLAVDPFVVQGSNSKIFDFSDRQFLLESQKAGKNLAQSLIYTPPPHSLIFLHRKLAGVYSILKNLEIRMDLSTYWPLMKELARESSK